MAFRYIQKKPCKFEGCPNMPKMGAGGYCYEHEEHDPGFQRKQKQAALKKDIKKSKMLIVSNPEVINIVASGAEMNRWFEARRKEMTGRCWHCGGRSSRDNDQYYRFSIAHILPKKLFKSVKTHPLNWIELCHFGKSCHTNFDNCMIDHIDLNCFDEMIKRFVLIYPDIAPEEKQFIPQVLLNYLEIEK